MRRLSSPSVPPRVRGLLLAALASLPIGCGGVAGLHVIHTGPPRPIEAIALAPLDLRLADIQPWNRYEKARDALAVIEAQPRLDAIAPWEYQRIDAPTTPREYLSQTNLGPRSRTLGIASDRVAVLELLVDERTRAERTRREGRRVVGESKQYVSSIRLEARLVHPASDTVLGRIERTLAEDRFLESPDYDDRPQVTALIRNGVADLLQGLLRAGAIRADAPERAPPPAALLESARPVLTWDDRGPSLLTAAADRDPLVREALLYARFRYFDPALTLGDFRAQLSAPAGLHVQAPGPLTVLHPGDVILCLAGRRVQWSVQWRRAWRREPPATATVQRAGKRVQVRLRPPRPGDAEGLPQAGCR